MLVSRRQTAFRSFAFGPFLPVQMQKKEKWSGYVIVLSCPQTAFFHFLFVVAEKRVWLISVGRFVLQTPRFWESLIGGDNYKSLFDEVSITIVTCSYVIK